MDKISIVKFLLAEIEEEQALFRAYHAAGEEATRQEKENLNKMDFSYWHYFNCAWKGRSPSKSRILNNSLKIRQLMQDITKETEGMRGCY